MFASLFIYVTDITLHLYMGQFQRNLYPNCSCFYVKIVDVLKQIALMKLTPNVKKKYAVCQLSLGKTLYLDRVKRIWYLSPMRAAKVQASLRIRAVSPEPSLLAHTNSESRGTFRQKARSLAPLNGWACAFKICNDGMLEDTNSLDGAHLISVTIFSARDIKCRSWK